MRSSSGPDRRLRYCRHLLWCAAARALRVAAIAARARVHRGDEDEPRGEGDRPRRARDGDVTLFERLPQHVEHVPAELRHLVEEQHAVMREADLAGPRDRSAADERDIGDGVMRRAKRSLGEQADPGRQRCRRPNGSRALERLLERQRRQNAWQPAREHRLARTRRTDHQQVVAARSGDLQRPARDRLPAEIAKIERRIA